MNIDFNTHILNQLLLQDRNKVELKEKFPKVDEWKDNDSKPTYLQLVNLAKFFNIPFGYFFLKEMPQKKYPIPHYRTMDNKKFEPSRELINTIETIDRRKQFASEILQEYKNPLPFAKSITLKTNIEEAAELVRDVLKLPVNWTISENLNTWISAFYLLVKRAEQAGIFVVVNSKENNIELDIKEFRGFVLYDEYAPFIFINGNDFISGKIFTIAHEIVHILIGENASFDLANLQPCHNDTEEFCNKVAAEFLVPKIILIEHHKQVGNDYNKLAEIFKVSKIVIARRLLDIGKINIKEFFTAYESFKISVKEVPLKGKGGHFYNAAPYKISREFFNIVYNSVKRNKILYRDAFKLTGLSPKAFDGLVNIYINKQ